MEKRNTAQKQAIRSVLCKIHGHPTAPMVVRELQKEGTPVSRATVFRVLAEAADEGIIGRVSLGDGQVRYDMNRTRHYHLRCRICGTIVDSDLPYREELDAIATRDGFEAEGHETVFYGTCASCRRAAEEGL